MDNEAGVWALIDHDYHESITAVYPTEVAALRVLNGRGYGRVAFLPWGSYVTDAIEPEQA